MNFQHLSPVDSPKTLLDLAFRKAREQGIQKNLQGNWLQIIRKKETLKLDIIQDVLVSRLEKVLKEFPDSNKLLPFYQELLKLTLDFGLFKKSLGGLNWAVQKIRFMHKEYVRKIVRETNRYKISLLSRQFYGRISSVLKQIQTNLDYLEKCRLMMRTYPDVQDLFTVCIYGFPNVGKTTLLNALTGVKAKVASYAFTTKSVNVGYFYLNGNKVQVMDVPGTLAREEKMNNIELIADLVVKKLAKVVIYVFDISGESEYSLKKQEELFEKIKENRKVLVYVSKKDLLKGSELKEFKYEYFDLEGLKKEMALMVG